MIKIDYFSKMMWVTFLKDKFEYFEKFKELKAMDENETDFKIKIIRSYNGGEFISK